ncbi:MAG: ribosome biogenesis GTP-binding protein YihA/YsxC [Endomicrobium sp.]|jgi:GTP-binding protein|nr:ribosome biogenesis GTP-binding protein YihA/YsxC [Endomicrobium sp.]
MLKKTFFLESIYNVDFLQASIAEVVFTGRSNVGKSSIINILCSQKKLAKTSKNPGSTKSINIYGVTKKKWIIDLPGYGYAKTSFRNKLFLSKILKNYIIERKSKKKVYIVIDAFVGPTKLDFCMANKLIDKNLTFKVIVNKFDKVININVNTKNEMKKELAKKFIVNESDIFILSAKSQDRELDKLKSDITNFLF